MRRWLLIDANGHRADELGFAHLVHFTSGDGTTPAPGDLADAAVRLADRAGGTRERLSALLVPLDGASTVDFEVGLRASVVAEGSL